MKLQDFTGTNTFRVISVACLILVLLIPMDMIESVIMERDHLYRQANDEVTASWGKQHLVTGPVISLPYLKQNLEHGVWSYNTLYRHVRPQNLEIEINVDTQIRYRSIYEVLLYTATIKMTGQFDLSDVAFTDNESSEFDIDEGYIQVPLGGPRSIRQITGLTWDGIEVDTAPQFLGENNRKVTLFSEIDPGLLEKDTPHDFIFEYVVTGSRAINIINNSPGTRLQIDGDWETPGFYGSYLPDSHTINGEQFTARWNINELLGGLGHIRTKWLSEELLSTGSKFGVRFVQPVDTYQQIIRSAKYAVLFIGLVFIVYFFTEILTRLNLHPVQYLLVGSANCIFYLLLLSLAEHINFMAAYVLSAIGSILIISLYSLSILKSRRYAILIFFMLASLYVYLYITLTSRGFALVIGSIGLFCILSLIMYLTRHVDWYNNAGNRTE